MKQPTPREIKTINHRYDFLDPEIVEANKKYYNHENKKDNTTETT